MPSIRAVMMVALAIAGLSPPGFAVRAQPGFPVRAQQRTLDADKICRSYLQAAKYGDDAGNIVVTSAPAMSLPPPPPPPALEVSAPPPPPPPPPTPSPGTNDVVVTGTRIASPSLQSSRAIAVIGGATLENRERYAGQSVANVQRVADAPVSTFGVDVDTGSYANVRRMLRDGQMPQSAAVRTEELLNYFRYDYPAPRDRTRPFTVSVDAARTPWNVNTRLLRIGLRGYDVPRAERPSANLVFLIDVSGSMASPDKLPLVQCSMALLANRLNPRDRVSVVVYAGAAGLVLAPTADKARVLDAIGRLQAGGSTAGAQGIALAYQTARASLIPGGINRVVLATDGDFNVGVTDDGALIDMIEREREGGITLTALGYGTGNYNEAMMERVADSGNGNYAYIDSAREADKVLGEELSSTLFTIAGDVKMQVEFNPAAVSEYRLIGYENRVLAEQDFANDRIDAGDIGAGHQVTALYEVVPAGATGWLPDRRYPANRQTAQAGVARGEAAHLRLRYKLPGETASRLIEQPVPASMLTRAGAPRGDLAFAAAVAGYGQRLRGDSNLGSWRFADSRALAARAGTDPLRAEFAELTRAAERLETSKN